MLLLLLVVVIVVVLVVAVVVVDVVADVVVVVVDVDDLFALGQSSLIPTGDIIYDTSPCQPAICKRHI